MVYSSPILHNCTFAGNLAVGQPGIGAGRGAGLNAVPVGTPILNNCLFTGNAATPYSSGSPQAGGMNAHVATLTNCTFSMNSAAGRGGGMGATSETVINNCIFWENSAGEEGPQIYGPAVVHSSCIQGGWLGNGNIDAAPMFVDADGPDDIVGTEDDDLHLQNGSPCVNAGDDDVVPGDIFTDFEGDDRIQQCRVDMGVDETPSLGPDCNENGAADACDIEQETSQDDNDNGLPDECEKVFYVDDDAELGGDGTTWPTAFRYLQDALAAAVADYPYTVEIRVAGGTYYPDQDEVGSVPPGDRTATFQPTIDLGLYGAYAGLSDLEDPDTRNMDLYETTLDGNIGDPEDDSDNSYHVLTGADGALFDGFTITGGYADGSGRNSDGGGMYNENCRVTVTNCTFVGNRCDAQGGAMANWNGHAYVEGCTFTQNTSVSWGGGMSNYMCDATIIDCTFSENVALYGRGGGLLNYLSSALITNCKFTGNSANSDGGGMYNYHCSPTVTNCAFSGNTATYGFGGGMSNRGDERSPTVANCTFSGNSATYGSGGGIGNEDSNATVVNCVLWGNSPDQIYDDSDATSTVLYSNVQGGWSGAGNLDTEPLFVDPDGLDDVVGTEDDNLRLSSGSPCIDAADNTAVPSDATDLDDDGDTDEPIPFDLDGNPRFIDDPWSPDTGAGDCPIVDMGAYEFQDGTTTCCPADLDGDGAVGAADLAELLGSWGPCEGCPADLDGDGAVGPFDLALLLGNWGLCS